MKARGVREAGWPGLDFLSTQPIKFGLLIFEPNPLNLIYNPTQFAILRFELGWVGLTDY